MHSLAVDMNNHRILPLAFTLTFALLLPLLALGGPLKEPAEKPLGFSNFLVRLDHDTSATWQEWHAKSENYAKLIRLDQR